MADISNQYENSSLSLKLLGTLNSSGLFIFDTEKLSSIAKELKISDYYLDEFIAKLIDRKIIKRLRRGLYAVSSTFSGREIPDFVIANNLVEPSAISHWSALHFHGLTEQVPNTVSAFTTKKVSSTKLNEKNSEWLVDGISYKFFTVKKEHYFGLEEIWIDDNFRVSMTDKERTVLELFVSPKNFGGIGEAFGIVENSLDELDVKKLVDYALKYANISVIKRLGWILDELKIPESKLKALRDFKSKGYKLLDPSKPNKGPCNKKWMLVENLRAEVFPVSFR